MRSPQTMGEDQPTPGISIFHATFSLEDHLSGGAASSATPSEPGPRNCGQWPEASATASRANNFSMATFSQGSATECVLMSRDKIWGNAACLRLVLPARGSRGGRRQPVARGSHAAIFDRLGPPGYLQPAG